MREEMTIWGQLMTVMAMGNRSAAFTEARRRAIALGRAISIFKLAGCADYIFRSALGGVPRGRWVRVATFEPDGTQSFLGKEE